MIAQSFIDDLLARTDIVEIVGATVQLRKAGANLLGLCPFHAEKSPSFTVSPTKQFYHCFGCGAHGNAIGFLIEHGGLGFVDAVSELAQRAGVDVPRDQGADATPRRDPGLVESLSLAARFYKRRLADTPHAIDYLKQRGLTGPTAARYAIGYAPDGWRSLEAGVPDYDAQTLVAAGLVIEGDASEGERRKRYDRFRDRIMFPIRNPRGQVIGFGGRVLGRGEPKYLNSPETDLFSKGRELYGLFESRDALRKENCAIVVEGYMDVVMLAEHGVGNAVATLGTATTGDHVRKLLRTVDRVVFAFDGDAAGRKAAWRALQACLPQSNDVKRIDFMFLPAEHDPDSFVRENGADGFAAALADATPLSSFMLAALRDGNDMDSAEGRARFLAQARPLMAELAAQGLRMQIVNDLATMAGIGRDELSRYLAEPDRSRRPAGAAQSQSGGDDGPPPGFDDEPPPGAAFGSYRSAPGSAFGRDGQRTGRGSRPGRWRGPPVPMARRPDLERRVRLLSACHPSLVRDLGDRAFLPDGLRRWFDLLEALDGVAGFESSCEALAADAPDDVARVRDDARRDPVVLGMDAEEAQAEVRDALTELRKRNLKSQIEALVLGGLVSADDRLKYQELIALQRQT